MHHRTIQKTLRILIVLLAALVSFGSTRLTIAKSTSKLPNFGAADPQPMLLKDIYTADNSSNPSSFYAFGSLFFFSASDPDHGTELWVSDGTSGGSHIVADLNPGEGSSNPNHFTRFNDRLFFTVDSNEGGFSAGFWSTDGTQDGTGKISDDYVMGLSVLGDWLYFSDNYGVLKRYGGANNILETVDTSNVAVGGEIVPINGKLYFSGTGPSGAELWNFDPASGQTSIVKDICPDMCGYSYYMNNGSLPDNLTVAGNKLFFTADDGEHGREVWVSDGTETGTQLLRDIYPGDSDTWPSDLTPAGGWVYFTADDAVHGRELWRSDGTPANTSMVADLAPGADASRPERFQSQSIAVLDTGSSLNVLFSARDATPGSGHGMELWSVPVTPAGSSATPTLIEIAPGQTGSYPQGLLSIGNTLYFAAQDTPGNFELWKSGGAPDSTARVADLVPGLDGSGPINLAAWNGKLVFNAVDSVHGREPWISDGSMQGTKMLGNLAVGVDLTGSSPSAGISTNVGGKNIRYFGARDALHGWELWRSDGTNQGTWMVKDIFPGPTMASSFGYYQPVTFDREGMAEVNGILYFAANTPDDGPTLWRTDGTTAGTWQVKAPAPGDTENEFRQFIAVDNKLFFLNYSRTRGEVLWVSDGATSGTQIVKVINPSSGWIWGDQLIALGDRLIFSEACSSEFWRSDGTPEGTQRFLGPYTSGYDCAVLRYSLVFDGKLYLSLPDPAHPEVGQQLWSTDGTTDGTQQVTVSGIYAYSDPTLMAQAGDNLFFVARSVDLDSLSTSSTLWMLPLGSTTASLRKWFTPFIPVDLQALNSDMFLALSFNQDTIEYAWTTVNASSGEIHILNSSGCYPGDSSDHAFLRGKMYFATCEPDANLPGSLWVTDGTEAGTKPISDPTTSLNFVNPNEFSNSGTHFFFSAEDARYGREPWVIRGDMDHRLFLPTIRK